MWFISQEEYRTAILSLGGHSEYLSYRRPLCSNWLPLDPTRVLPWFMWFLLSHLFYEKINLNNSYYSITYFFVNIIQLSYSFVCLPRIHKFYRIIYPKVASLYHQWVYDCGKVFERSHQILLFFSPILKYIWQEKV